MFFNTPPPNLYNNNDISISEYSKLISNVSQPAQSSNQLSEASSESYPTKSPYLLNKTVKWLPLTNENLKKYVEFTNKKEYIKNPKYININSVKDKKIIKDFNSPITIKQIIDFTTYYVNKKNLPKNEKNKLIFSIFENIIQIKESPLNFNKKELVSAYVYLDRIYNTFGDFNRLNELFLKNNNIKHPLFKYCERITIIMALMKTMSVYNKHHPLQDYIKSIFIHIYTSVDEEIGDNISLDEYQRYSKKFFS